MPEQVKILKDYELVLVYKPELGDDGLSASVDKVSQFITSRGGEVVATNNWGKQKMAYPIERFVDAYYVLLQIKFNPGTARELEANLNISEELLRHLLVRSQAKA